MAEDLGNKPNDNIEFNDDKFINPPNKEVDDEIYKSFQESLKIRQNEIISKHLKSNYPNLDNITPKEIFNSEDEEIQKKIQDLYKNREFNLDLKYAEEKAHAEIFKKHKDHFKNIDWEQKSDDTRIKTLKNSDGQDICKLTETMNEGFDVQTSKGNIVNIQKYRNIDIKPELDDVSGPVHMSFALKKANGKNIDADKAVYFTVHYDDNGKLADMSYPQALQFDPKTKVGYIERDGEVYTLPIKENQFNELQKELFKNTSQAQDIYTVLDKTNSRNKDLKEEVKNPEHNNIKDPIRFKVVSDKMENHPLYKKGQKEADSQANSASQNIKSDIESSNSNKDSVKNEKDGQIKLKVKADSLENHPLFKEGSKNSKLVDKDYSFADNKDTSKEKKYPKNWDEMSMKEKIAFFENISNVNSPNKTQNKTQEIHQEIKPNSKNEKSNKNGVEKNNKQELNYNNKLDPGSSVGDKIKYFNERSKSDERIPVPNNRSKPTRGR